MSGWATHTPGEPWGDSRAGLARRVGESRSAVPAAEVVDAVPVEGHALGVQLHLGGTSRVLAPKVAPIGDRASLGVKPRGGLWTSTWLGAGVGSGWVRWCVEESYGDCGDCESTLWLRWCFADVIELGPRGWDAREPIDWGDETFGWGSYDG